MDRCGIELVELALGKLHGIPPVDALYEFFHRLLVRETMQGVTYAAPETKDWSEL
ncbi:MAG: hypothetical protein ACKODH_16165 [Limisphaerales bacterium]